MRIVGCLFLALISWAPALGAPDKSEEAPSVVKRAVKAFSRLRSYRVDLTVTGGRALGADHRVAQPTVSQRYQGAVRGKLMQIQQPVAIRAREDANRGALQENGQWKAMLASDSGRLLARLFAPPEQILAEVAQHRKRAEWVEVEEARPGSLPRRGARSVTQASDENESPGNEVSTQPQRIEIRVLGQAALQHFLRIQSSGCFSEG